MLLAIDSGNTNVVFALWDGPASGGKVRAQWRIESHDRRTADEYFVWLKQLMDHGGFALNQISGIALANVRPASAFALEKLCVQHLKLKPLNVGAETTKLDLTVQVDEGTRVGADRLVNAYAAKMQHPGRPAILIDTGTATTLDVLSSSGAYVGGIIAPGVHVSAKALADAAAQLPLVAIEKPASAIGTSTRSAMQSGLFWGYVAMLEGLVERLRSDMLTQDHAAAADEIHVVGTGGMMKVLKAGLSCIDEFAPDLTIQGLAHICEANPS